MKVLVTGSKGFIGRNLVTALNREEHVEVAGLESSMDDGDLAARLPGCQVIFHLAGVNRPEDDSEFARINTGLTQTLVDQLTETSNRPLVVLASSTQASLDNPYGRSKKAAEDVLIRAHQHAGLPIKIYRLPGVFGKWSRPNYNTVVATFCHNIANGIDISIADATKELQLAYVDDVIAEMIQHVRADHGASDSIHATIKKTHTVTLGDLADRIRKIHESRETLHMPDVGDELNRCLYPTYLSFVKNDHWARPVQLRTDDRGWLFELIKSPSFGQIFVSTTKPGITRGNHYHDSKIEKFCLIQGQGLIRFRHVDSNDVIAYPVDDKQVQIVDIPPGYTHSIENVGNQEMIVLFWASEIFDPDVPDTFWEPVLK